MFWDGIGRPYIRVTLYHNLPILFLGSLEVIWNVLGHHFRLLHGLCRPHRPRVLQEDQRVEHGAHGAADGDGVGRVVPEDGFEPAAEAIV